jgi:hypothetical protein
VAEVAAGSVPGLGLHEASKIVVRAVNRRYFIVNILVEFIEKQGKYSNV